ncbi:hypothetical protein SCUP515_09356 [Seiridium cupressi]
MAHNQLKSYEFSQRGFVDTSFDYGKGRLNFRLAHKFKWPIRSSLPDLTTGGDDGVSAEVAREGLSGDYAGIIVYIGERWTWAVLTTRTTNENEYTNKDEYTDEAIRYCSPPDTFLLVLPAPALLDLHHNHLTNNHS